MRVLKFTPPLLLMLVTGALMWLVAANTPAISMDMTSRLVGAALPVAAGIGFCLAGGLSFISAGTTVDPRTPGKASVLVTSGVYQYSRNPMYVGFELCLLGWAVCLAAPWALVGPGLFFLYMDRLQIPHEEQALEQLFGESYARYRSRVRRWI